MLHTWSDEEVSEAWSMIANEGKRRKKVKTQKLKSTLSPGNKVKFESSKMGTCIGHIIRVKTKNAIVEVKGQDWNVPMSMLTKV
jgi:transcription antitermination factor NusG